MTPAQARYLSAIRAAGPAGRTYNGRARRPLEALRDAGLIALEYDLVPRDGGRWVERFTAKAGESLDKAAPQA